MEGILLFVKVFKKIINFESRLHYALYLMKFEICTNLWTHASWMLLKSQNYTPFTKTISNIYDLGLSKWSFKKGFTPPVCGPGILDIVCTDRFKIFLNSAWFLKFQKLLPTQKNPKYQGQPTFAAFKVFLSQKQDILLGSL